MVVLPAPFGPRNPVIVPGASENVSSSTAVIDPNRFVRPSIETTAPAASTGPEGVLTRGSIAPTLGRGGQPTAGHAPRR